MRLLFIKGSTLFTIRDLVGASRVATSKYTLTCLVAGKSSIVNVLVTFQRFGTITVKL
jgi:hypothetical protein